MFVYLNIIHKHQGIPEQAEAPPVARVPASAQTANPPAPASQSAQPASAPTSGPNANPLDLFPQVGIGVYLIKKNVGFFVWCTYHV